MLLLSWVLLRAEWMSGKQFHAHPAGERDSFIINSSPSMISRERSKSESLSLSSSPRVSKCSPGKELPCCQRTAVPRQRHSSDCICQDSPLVYWLKKKISFVICWTTPVARWANRVSLLTRRRLFWSTPSWERHSSNGSLGALVYLAFFFIFYHQKIFFF